MMLFGGCKTEIGGGKLDPNDPNVHLFPRGTEYKLQGESESIPDGAKTLEDD